MGLPNHNNNECVFAYKSTSVLIYQLAIVTIQFHRHHWYHKSLKHHSTLGAIDITDTLCSIGTLGIIGSRRQVDHRHLKHDWHQRHHGNDRHLRHHSTLGTISSLGTTITLSTIDAMATLGALGTIDVMGTSGAIDAMGTLGTIGSRQ